MNNDKKKPLWFRHLPNQLTFLRILIVPIILIFFPSRFRTIEIVCAFLFLIGSLSDWLDGFLARKLRLESNLGALLDPIADKILACAGLVAVCYAQRLWGWMTGLLLCREIAISGLRLVAIDQGYRLKVNYFGKIKTIFLDGGIICLMINRPLFDIPIRQIGMVSIWITLVISYYSAWLYVNEYTKQFPAKNS